MKRFRVARSPAPHYPQTTSDQAHLCLISALPTPQTPHLDRQRLAPALSRRGPARGVLHFSGPVALFQLRYVISHRARRFQFEVSITEMMASALLHPVFDENHFIGPKIAEKLSSYQRLSSKESATENNRFRDASSFLVNLPPVGVSAASAELH